MGGWGEGGGVCWGVVGGGVGQLIARSKCKVKGAVLYERSKSAFAYLPPWPFIGSCTRLLDRSLSAPGFSRTLLRYILYISTGGVIGNQLSQDTDARGSLFPEESKTKDQNVERSH